MLWSRLCCVTVAMLGLGLVTASARGVPRGEKWVRLDTEHFTVFSNAGARQAVEIGDHLETFRGALIAATRGLEVNSPLPTFLYLFRSEAAFRPYKLGEDGKPKNIAGYFMGRRDGNYVAIDASAGSRIFRLIHHEYFHYFMQNNLPDLPVWLNEGLAEYYSSFQARRGVAEIGRPIDSHLNWLSRGSLIPLEELFQVERDSPVYNEGVRQGTFYAQSWALTHYLLSGDDEHRKKMGEYLARVDRGDDPVPALLKVYGTDIASLEKKLYAYTRKGQYMFFTLPFDEDGETVEAALQSLEAPEAIYHLSDLLAHRHPLPEQEVKLHVQEVLRLAPSHSGAYEILGYVEDAKDNLAEARRLYELAIRHGPRNASAYSRCGRTYLREFDQGGHSPDGEDTPPLLLQARDRLQKSLEIHPDDPETLAALGRTYRYDSGDVSAGISALVRAAQALPSRTDILYSLIVLTARSGNPDGARVLLDRSLRSRGDDQTVRFAERVIEVAEANQVIDRYNEAIGAINAGEWKRALALLNEVIRKTRDADLKQAAEGHRIRVEDRLQEELPAAGGP